VAGCQRRHRPINAGHVLLRLQNNNSNSRRWNTKHCWLSLFYAYCSMLVLYRNMFYIPSISACLSLLVVYFSILYVCFWHKKWKLSEQNSTQHNSHRRGQSLGLSVQRERHGDSVRKCTLSELCAQLSHILQWLGGFDAKSYWPSKKHSTAGQRCRGSVDRSCCWCSVQFSSVQSLQ